MKIEAKEIKVHEVPPGQFFWEKDGTQWVRLLDPTENEQFVPCLRVSQPAWMYWLAAEIGVVV